MSQSIDVAERSRRTENILVRLKRLLPGNTSGLKALEDPEGSGLVTEPGDIARVLTEHWGRVLTSKPVDSRLLNRWLRDLPDKLPPAADACWHITKEHVLESVRRSHETSPGPDGIPYKAFKKLGLYAVEYLFDAAEDLQEDDVNTAEIASFNHAILCCLPKVASKVDPLHGDIHQASQTRPLSVVNTDNRLIANAYRIMMEPIMNGWVSDMQQGFLEGRSMLSNIVDVDFDAMKVSLQHEGGSVILFDFAAAFPSLSQDYLWNVLAHIGVASGPLTAIKRLYHNNLHYIKVKSNMFPSFTATSGVRQGCPLSPLLFAVVADVLLRRLQRELSDITVRAFADDTAVVSTDFARQAPLIMQIFKEFGRISNLNLNMQKTVLVPLWESSVDSVKSWLKVDLPDWDEVEVSWHARYLGFTIGPERGSQSWAKASRKFSQRLTAWSRLRLGMYMNAQVYRSLCVSVFSFLWQLEDSPAEVLELEPWALRKLAPGPGNWIRPADLKHLRRYGHPFEFPDFQLTSLAAKMRVYHCEPQLNCRTKHDELLRVLATAPLSHKSWHNCYNNSHILTLTRARDQAESLGITLQSLTRAAAARGSKGSSQRRAHAQPQPVLAKCFQSLVLRDLARCEAYNHEYVIRSKLKRWHITSAPEGTLARRACKILRSAFDSTPVRVANVLFRTWCNGWCTARRFQKTTSMCLFGCSSGSLPGCHDSIEHYACCQVVRQFALQTVNLPPRVVGTLQGFLCLVSGIEDHTLIVQQLLLYAVYTASNRYRHGPAPPACASIQELLLQYVHQGAAQASLAQAALNKQIASKYKRRRLDNAAWPQGPGGNPGQTICLTPGQHDWSTDDDCEPECSRSRHRCIKSTWPTKSHFATAAAARHPVDSIVGTRFVPGGDHFMTTSFTS